jgi:hypothetical protein
MNGNVMNLSEVFTNTSEDEKGFHLRPKEGELGPGVEVEEFPLQRFEYN